MVRHTTSLALRESRIWPVGDEHVAGRVGDGYFRLAFHDDTLGSHTTGPEDWNIVFFHNNGISPIRMREICNAQSLRISAMNGCAMSKRVAAGNFDRQIQERRGDGAHRDDEATMETRGGGAGDRGAIHSDVFALIQMTKTNALFDEGSFC